MTDDITLHLNDVMNGKPISDLLLIAGARNAVPARRIASLLLLLMASDSPLCEPASELVYSLTAPGWDRADIEPVETPLGREMLARVNDPSSALTGLAWSNVGPLHRMAATLILRAVGGECPTDDAGDLSLKILSGHDTLWWMEWVREHRGSDTDSR